MKIGLISDTHGYLDPLVFTHFDGCSQILHAGDVGDVQILDQLHEKAPTSVVYGNIDDNSIRKNYPENVFLNIEGLKILMTHIAGTPPRYNSRVKALIKENEPDILICGHSHILKVERDPLIPLIYINPGAAGIHGFHKIRTIMTFEINKGKLMNMNVIELGKRGSLK